MVIDIYNPNMRFFSEIEKRLDTNVFQNVRSASQIENYWIFKVEAATHTKREILVKIKKENIYKYFSTEEDGLKVLELD